MATKEDLKGFATKEDLKNFATKDDLRELTDEIISHVDWFALPVFNQDDEANMPEAAKAFKETIRAASAAKFD